MNRFAVFTMTVVLACSGAAVFVGCMTVADKDGNLVRVLDEGKLNEVTDGAANIGNMIFPGIGVVIKSIGGIIAFVGAADRRKKLG